MESKPDTCFNLLLTAMHFTIVIWNILLITIALKVVLKCIPAIPALLLQTTKVKLLRNYFWENCLIFSVKSYSGITITSI